MRDNFYFAFDLVIGLEGKPTNDPNDPGGFTIWGLAKAYHPWISMSTTKDQAKEVYLKEYWIPSGCDDRAYPMDVILFDGSVNPQNDPNLEGVGNAELLLLLDDPDDWKGFLIERMARYARRSKIEYVRGHIARVDKLWDAVRTHKA